MVEDESAAEPECVEKCLKLCPGSEDDLLEPRRGRCVAAHDEGYGLATERKPGGEKSTESGIGRCHEDGSVAAGWQLADWRSSRERRTGREDYPPVRMDQRR